MFRSIGKVVYDPPRGTMKNRTQWWCILNIDREITRYYRWWVTKQYNPFGITDWKVHAPAWDAHVSIIRGERPPQDKMHLWKKYQGQRFDFEYYPVGNFYAVPPRKGEAPGLFFLIDVECPELVEIRKEFGFKYDWKLHLTFGRTYE